MDREAAAVRVQAAARGMAVRRAEARRHAAVTVIQRLWRGHAARKEVKAILQGDIANLLLQIYRRAATRIQATWRGYWVRKRVFCYRLYVDWQGRCLHRGRTLMQEMLHQRELLQEEDRNKAESEAEKCSQLVLRKLHHLVSTKSTPGVFNSPRNPSVKAVEDGLRQLRFHSMPSSVSTNNGLADQVRALDWEATRSRKLSVQRALHLPETWKTRLRSLQSIST
ncbi:spermatogenesis-associated protein 17-like isoform X2 [Frankliniella occidentalis]|uniref:Spermatogenesis-associated protein 17-like isoform X2 n=1 Tax=Frankliniella occidentalis TaxID=133901 RepID=A0A6J1S9G4_FRAOC|nr:spermatogenesis-associated protein 17-like isoform X2 [Frankliniella occidentalis]